MISSCGDGGWVGVAALEVWADKVCTAFVPLEVTKLLLCGGIKASSKSYGLKNEPKRLLETETELEKKKVWTNEFADGKERPTVLALF